MIQVNNEYFYEDLTYDSMTQLMQDWKDGKEPKVGPQNGRINSCGPGEEGRTSLFDEPTGPVTRDFAAEMASYEEAKAAAAAAKKWNPSKLSQYMHALNTQLTRSLAFNHSSNHAYTYIYNNFIVFKTIKQVLSNIKKSIYISICKVLIIKNKYLYYLKQIIIHAKVFISFCFQHKQPKAFNWYLINE